MGEWRAAEIQEVKELHIPKHKNIDRYVITRMIEDYPKNKAELEKPEEECYEKDAFLGICKKSRRERIKLECSAVDRALQWTDGQDNNIAYRRLLKMVFWTKSHNCLGARDVLQMSRYECDRFLDGFRAIVAGVTGRLIPI